MQEIFPIPSRLTLTPLPALTGLYTNGEPTAIAIQLSLYLTSHNRGR